MMRFQLCANTFDPTIANEMLRIDMNETQSLPACGFELLKRCKPCFAVCGDDYYLTISFDKKPFV